ncbi:hypothetical protein PVA17_18540 [Lysinibacillus sp. CNPSo 3705]|uniref:hypothetical protein n=1 Tax=Lysinibacillus sp. CNPSo 3705 TaxID=3028148 RepID=UPI002363BC21|nr:hypothetical protein [Lysinibacillus sp. CNPSo 3705]MDD1504745.1 hypothetical protein [Lysinibacillus sp. CNPSo 3705]
MSIKFQCRIELPYIIRLNEAKDYEKDFYFPEFEKFHLRLLFNDIDYYNIYNDKYEESVCKFILIEVISKNYNYKDYRVNKITKKIEGEQIECEESVADVPDDVAREIMSEISIRLNHVLRFIRENTKMFWIEEIPINRINKMVGIFSSFYFYAPTYELDRNMRYNITFLDTYIDQVESEKVDDNFFENFNVEENEYTISFQFLDKAQSALYDSKFKDVIIFASIAQESFISKFIEDISIEGDIVFDKLNSIFSKLMDLKYNVILKCLKSRSLKEINSEYWNSINSVYKLRNDIMHTGVLKDESKLSFEKLDKDLSNIRKAFNEILAL